MSKEFLTDLLIANTSSENYDKSETSYPLGVCYLASSASSAGFSVDFFDSYREPWSEAQSKFEQTLKDKRPRVIGFSMLSFNRNSARRAATIAKQILPGCVTICGGPHASPMHDQILKHYDIDIVAQGEGEHTLVEILKAGGDPAALQNVSGISFKNGSEIVHTPYREFIQNLDDIPYPNHDLFADKIRKESRAFVITTRGCPGRCHFCVSTLQLGAMYRMRSAENVLDEIKELYNRYKITKLGLQDDAFTLNKQRTFDFCDGLESMGLDLEWSASTRVNAFNQEIATAMRRAGCKTLAFGVESGSAKLLKAMNKRVKPEQIIEAIRISNEAGFTTGVLLMVGTPGENWSTVKETVSLVKQASPAEVKSVALLQIFPGTHWYKHCQEKGYLDDSYWLTEKPVPYYTFENSELKLMIFGFMISFASQWKLSPFRGIKYFFSVLYTYRRRIVAGLFEKLGIKTS